MNGSLNWGIVGCGDVCEVKSGPALYKCRDSALVAVMRRNIDKAKAFAERHHVPAAYGTVQELLDDPRVNCVYVATPPGGDRIGIARAIVEAGKPCYSEKPLARDAHEAQEIVGVFRDANLPLYCAYYRRCMPKFHHIKKIIVPLLGVLTSVTITLRMPTTTTTTTTTTHPWHFDPSVSGGGLLLDVGCHMLDMVDYLVGPMEDCHGVAAASINGGVVEDSVRGYWTHTMKDGRKVLGSCLFDFCSPAREDEIRIDGSNGAVSFSCLDTTEPPKLSPGLATTAADNDYAMAHVHQPMVQDIVEELVHGIPSARLCRGSDALRTSQVMDKLLNNRKRWNEKYM